MGNRDRRDKHPPTCSRSAAWGVLRLCWKAQGGRRDPWEQGSASRTIPAASHGSRAVLGHPGALTPQTLPPSFGGCAAGAWLSPASVAERGASRLPRSLTASPGWAAAPAVRWPEAEPCACGKGRRASLQQRASPPPPLGTAPRSPSLPARTCLGVSSPVPTQRKGRGCFQPVARGRDAAPTQRQSSSCAREDRENELAAVQGARGPRDTVAEEMQPLQRQMTAAASAAACLCHTFLCPRHVAPGARSCSRPESRDGDKRAGGEAECCSAAGRVFQLRRWRGNTCGCPRCPPALAPWCRRVNGRLQPAAAPSSLSRRAGGSRAAAGWNRRSRGTVRGPRCLSQPCQSQPPATPQGQTPSCFPARQPGPRSGTIPPALASPEQLSQLGEQTPCSGEVPTVPTALRGDAGQSSGASGVSGCARRAQTAGRSGEGPEPGGEGQHLFRSTAGVC